MTRWTMRGVNRVFAADFLARLSGRRPGARCRHGDGANPDRSVPAAAAAARDCRGRRRLHASPRRSERRPRRVGGAHHVDVGGRETLPYGDGTFAAVMSNSIVHHIPEPRSVLAEMARVVQPRASCSCAICYGLRTTQPSAPWSRNTPAPAMPFSSTCSTRRYGPR